MTDALNFPNGKPKKYWVYQHDHEGNFVKDIVYVDKLKDAIDAVGDAIEKDYPWSLLHSIHVVDQEQDGRTVWIAGSCTVDGREQYAQSPEQWYQNKFKGYSDVQSTDR